MGIDRPDEDDAPDAGHDSPDAGNDAPTLGRDSPAQAEHDGWADSEADRKAFSLKYRAEVEAAYQAVRDSWAEAVPGLKSTWAEVKKLYPGPERSRSTHDRQDGSWCGDGDRYLDSQQNAEVTAGRTYIREKAESDIIPAMHRIEGADPERHLAGLDRCIKGEDRLKEKIADRLRLQPELTASQALAEVPDLVRFTFAYSETHYAEGVRADVERLKAEGFELIKLKNLWGSDQYKGINSQWRSQESEVLVEIQFHTQASFEAKQLTHAAYERIRSPLTGVDEEQALKNYQREVCAMIPDVPGVAEIEDYRPEKLDG